ncbi:Glycosyltransferase involved in cell wall bisynthesis [Tindallia magadiensis]|uniref:Glycosyltransferase involved in cell wall bisynthesis n=1 Tax=Tindallia magadiensis TaxID=69895 RepID=A0A1I3D304_9FIRM|nr:glycosyltransferase family 4 protein [Tindallia magadiensis]SFH81083.1 Glycosyltransferase involved in cell wall bisynthesis [Tindallia magadiensis]
MEKVAMFVFNNFTNDSRVLKEAKTLIDHSYQVDLYAVLDDKTLPEEIVEGIHVKRMLRDPWHMRFLKKFREAKKPKQQSQATTTSPTPAKPTNKKIAALKRKYTLLRKKMAAKKLVMGKKTKAKVYEFMKINLLKFHRPFIFWDYYVKCTKANEQQQYAIYHAHDLNTLPVAYWLAKKHNGKLIYDAHEFYVERNTKIKSRTWKFILTRIESYLIRKCHAVISVNESLAEEYTRRYGVKKPYVIMNAPSQNMASSTNGEEELRSHLPISPSQKVLLYCGSITFNRGLEKLIESLVYTKNYYLVMMGYGTEEYKNSLLEIAEEQGVKDRFSFFGPVAPHEVTSYAATADLGVAPIENACLSYYYCSPNKVFEYINAKIPVITSNFPEMERVVQEYEIGCTFNPEDAQDIAKAAETVLENEALRTKMAHNTAAASKAYNWENEADKLIKIYQDVRDQHEH